MTTRVLTQAEIDALKTAMQARFNKGLAEGNKDWMKIARKITSNSASNTYAWISQFPAFREWVGARLHKAVAERAYQVVNRKFETTLDIPREDLEDDNYGMYADLAESFGISVDDLMNDLIYNGVPAGFSSVCYDGQFFFDTDHPVYPNEDGTGVAATVSNVQAGAGEPWVLLCTKKAPQPFYLQERTKAEFVAKTSALTSDGVFENDVFSFGGRWRGDSVYGFWQLAFGSKATLDETNFNANYKAMMKFKGDGNRKLGIVADTLLVGPDNLSAAETLLKAINKANGASNTNYGKVELIATPWMAL